MKLNSLGPNQTEIEVGDVTVLFSYKTPVAFHVTGKGYFRTKERFSSTTTKHINKWLQHHGGSAFIEEVEQDVLENLLDVSVNL